MLSNLHILPVGPADHHSIILSGAWTEPAAYNDSANRFIYEVCDPVPSDATALMLRIKLKCYVPAGEGPGYCQGNIRFVNDDAVMNHLAHVDEWGRGPGHSGEGRRIQYVSLFAPIVDGKVGFDLGYEISGRGVVEFVVYLEGYVASATGARFLTEVVGRDAVPESAGNA